MQEIVEIVCLRLPAGSDGVIKLLIVAQAVSPPLERQRDGPLLLVGAPQHAGDAAGVVFPDGPLSQHLDAGAVYIGQPRDPAPLAHAAGGAVSAAEVLGLNDRLSAAAAPAQPRCPAVYIFRRAQNGQVPVLLAAQIQPFS